MELLREFFEDGSKQITKVNKRPLTGNQKNNWLLSEFNLFLAATLFKNSMADLVGQLSSKLPFYIRCIKPNENKSSKEFDIKRVEHQVKLNLKFLKKF